MWCKNHDMKMKKVLKLLLFVFALIIAVIAMKASKVLQFNELYYLGWLLFAVTCCGIVIELKKSF